MPYYICAFWRVNLKRTIHKYIFGEVWPVFLSTLLIFTLIVVASRILSIMEWVVNRGIHPIHVIKLVLFLLPKVILFVLPAATLMAVLIGFLRMSGDNEIIALNASGISLHQMLPPVVALSLAGCFLAGFISLFASPWGNRAFQETIFRIVQSRADIQIKERIFYEVFDDVVFYVNSISSKEGVMQNVFVVDKRDQDTTHSIVAKEGRILHGQEKNLITIRFINGVVFMGDRELTTARTMHFKTYDLNLNLKDIIPPLDEMKRSPDELYLKEILQQLREIPKGEVRNNELVIKLFEIFTIPLAVIFMGLIGAPLGAQIRSQGRSVGIALGLVVFLAYYLCLMGARSICEQGAVQPAIGMWLPSFFLAVCCFSLFRSARWGGATDLDQWIHQWAERIRNGFKGNGKT